MRHILLTLLCALLLLSCSEADNRFSDYRARFTYSPVSAVPTLYRACTSLGEFCSITFPVGNKYLVKSPSTPSVADEIPRTALHGYQNFYLGLGNAGLIVGLPTLPEMLEAESQVVCYSIVCANCHENYNTLKQLTLQVGGTAKCSSCQRSYDLNNQGIVAQGEDGRSLYRHYVHYSPISLTLTVNSK